jgi:drug/metabolite transporter (DMT)-like permease
MAGGIGGAQRQHDGRIYAAVGAAALCRRTRRTIDAVLALRSGVALAVAALFMQIDLRRALRGGGWRIVLLGATLGSAQTLCFWESLKTLETSIAVLLFYTYPAVTLALDRLIVKQPIRPIAVLCIAVMLGGAALITLPGVRGGMIDLRGLLWAIPSPLI